MKHLVAGVIVGAAGAAHGQIEAHGVDASVPPAGGIVVYDNAYDGTSTFANRAQKYEVTFSAYDIWLGDDFSTEVGYQGLEISVMGLCEDGCVDPFQVQDFCGRVYDGLPNDPTSILIAESDGFRFDGLGTWTSEFSETCLPAGDFVFCVAARNDFAHNGQMNFFQQNATQKVDNGWQWNPGGAFGFPDDLLYLMQIDDLAPASPNAVITAAQECDDCFADCDGNGVLNILDFVCVQGLFQAGDAGADCDGDGELNILDFVCFQSEFNDGC